ncbi:MAG: hypothetical protein FJX72_20440 [Armatimonadetes bacterium]|nr:hypothetical protein [Armatimonadota bacterium]
MSATRAYDEIIDLIAAGVSSADVVGFKPSDTTQRRVSELLEAEKEERLSADDAAELAHYLEAEHIMRLAKVRARARMLAA